MSDTMMDWNLRLLGIAAVLLAPACAHGHGTPIHVEAANDQLIVSGGMADTAGFAPMIFLEDDEDGEPFGAADLPGFGPATLWQIPGYDIFGLQENSGLYVEPLARPVKDSDPSESRVLWYWNPATEIVERAAATTMLDIRKTPSQHATLLASSETPTPPLQLAAPVASEMGFHNHLVLYAINDPAPTGAYGFFARLTSNLYAPSDPFLLVINNGTFDYEQMVPAGLAINSAAFLPGDFNHDDVVDAADYTVWRDGLGTAFSTNDYNVWKSHFGSTAGGEGSAATGLAAVPEPSGLVLSVLAILAALAKMAGKNGRQEARPGSPERKLQAAISSSATPAYYLADSAVLAAPSTRRPSKSVPARAIHESPLRPFLRNLLPDRCDRPRGAKQPVIAARAAWWRLDSPRPGELSLRIRHSR